MLVLWSVSVVWCICTVNGANGHDAENEIQTILKRLATVESKVERLENENMQLQNENRRIWDLLIISGQQNEHLRHEKHKSTNKSTKMEPTREDHRLRSQQKEVTSEGPANQERTKVYHKGDSNQNKRLLLGASTGVTRVAFKAGTSKTINQIGGHQAIEFDKVLLNEGNAYSPLHGHMIAPLKGIYLLSFSIYALQSTTVAFEIVLNGNRIDTLYAAGSSSIFTSQSRTFPIVLEQGDMVWIRTYPGFEGVNIYGGDTHFYNSFSGVLLYEMI